MPVPGLENGAWDGGTCTRLRWGSIAVPCTKITLPKLEIKTEKVRRIGEMLATKRTPGAAELGPLKVSMLAADYKEFVLLRYGKHAGTETEFVLTTTIIHPSVRGSLSRLADHCRIVTIEELSIEASEKALMIDLTIDPMDLWERGDDDVWKTLVRKSTLTSADAQVLLSFGF
jgi:hypothetical protein